MNQEIEAPIAPFIPPEVLQQDPRKPFREAFEVIASSIAKLGWTEMPDRFKEWTKFKLDNGELQIAGLWDGALEELILRPDGEIPFKRVTKTLDEWAEIADTRVVEYKEVENRLEYTEDLEDEGGDYSTATGAVEDVWGLKEDVDFLDIIVKYFRGSAHQILIRGRKENRVRRPFPIAPDH